MSGPDMSTDTVAKGLAAFLSDTFGRPVTTSNLVASSAGARRGNILFDAHDGDRTLGLVATIIPTSEIEINPITAEAAIRDLAEQHGVPVPHIHAVCTDPSYVGGPFFLSTRVDGESVPRRVLRLVHAEGIGERVAEQLGEALGHLHAIDPALAPQELRRRRGRQPRRHRAGRDRGDGLEPGAEPAGVRPRAALARAPPALDRPRATRSCTPTSATATSSSTRPASPPCSTGRAPAAAATRCRTWPGRRCACGASARTSARSAASPGATRSSPATSAPAARSTSSGSSGGRSSGTLRWGLGLAGQAAAHLDGRFSTVVMAASGRRVPELEWDLLMLLRPGA